MIAFSRLLQHLSTTRWRLRRLFPPSALATIRAAIDASDATHTGHIRFAVESALHGAPLFHGQPPLERAIHLFGELRVWDTEDNNGVLIYVLLADRAVEIVVDRGICARVGQGEWDAICRQMEREFKKGDFEAGTLAGIKQVAECLAMHFPERVANAVTPPDAAVSQ